jgi:acyl-CoA reductase-like NAD-dependent aldehyde dehydrogenase
MNKLYCTGTIFNKRKKYERNLLMSALNLNLLKLPPPLDNLDEQETLLLRFYLETRTFQPGAEITLAGSYGECFYIVDQGTVRVALVAKEQNPQDQDVLFFLEAGNILGELSLLDQLPRTLNAFAHTEVSARCLTRRALSELSQLYPAVALKLYQALGRSAAQKLRATNDRLGALLQPRRIELVEQMVSKAVAAQAEIVNWPEAKIDRLLYALAQAVAGRAEELARLTVAETGMGNVEDKTFKNRFGSLGIYRSLVGKTGFGKLRRYRRNYVIEIASPVGVIFGIIPVTHPVSTMIFKVLCALKSRNAIILSPHHRALGICSQVGQLLQEVLRQQGAPEELVQYVGSRTSREITQAFMRHPGVGLILATGGPALVKAAYSSGKPAIGVGSGNTPVLVCADARLAHAAKSIVSSKSFDNGVVCASEQTLIVEEPIREKFMRALEKEGAAVLNSAEITAFNQVVLDSDRPGFKPEIVGQPAAKLAAHANIRRSYPIKIIVVPAETIALQNPYSHEKLAPIASLVSVRDWREGLKGCEQILEIDGTGHTTVIYSRTKAVVQEFGRRMNASRILVNSPATQGVMGTVTGLVPSFTLGCGTFGGNSTTDNVTYSHLINVKRLAYYRSTPLQLAHYFLSSFRRLKFWDVANRVVSRSS